MNLRWIVCAVSLGGLLFGFDSGVISGCEEAIVAMPETNGRHIDSPHLANDADVRAGCRGTGFKLK